MEKSWKDAIKMNASIAGFGASQDTLLIEAFESPQNRKCGDGYP
ncbi:MAG: hypothetical protein PHQ13_04635 [Rhodoferax sp.]|nr:hypothetical protein [Rhodoferax sp.]